MARKGKVVIYPSTQRQKSGGRKKGFRIRTVGKNGKGLNSAEFYESTKAVIVGLLATCDAFSSTSPKDVRVVYEMTGRGLSPKGFENNPHFNITFVWKKK